MAPWIEKHDVIIERAARFIGRARTLVIILCVDAAWGMLNIVMKDGAFDPPPFRILTRASLFTACLVIALAWANRKRLEREASARAARSLEVERDSDDELEAMLRAAVRIPLSRGESAEGMNDRGRAISSRDN